MVAVPLNQTKPNQINFSHTIIIFLVRQRRNQAKYYTIDPRTFKYIPTQYQARKHSHLMVTGERKIHGNA